MEVAAFKIEGIEDGNRKASQGSAATFNIEDIEDGNRQPQGFAPAFNIEDIPQPSQGFAAAFNVEGIEDGNQQGSYYECFKSNKRLILYAIANFLLSIGWSTSYIQSKYVKKESKGKFYALTFTTLFFLSLSIFFIGRLKCFKAFWDFSNTTRVKVYFSIIAFFEIGLMVWAAFFVDHIIEEGINQNAIVASGLAGINSIILGKLLGYVIFALTPTLASITINLGVTRKDIEYKLIGIGVGIFISLIQKVVEYNEFVKGIREEEESKLKQKNCVVGLIKELEKKRNKIQYKQNEFEVREFEMVYWNGLYEQMNEQLKTLQHLLVKKTIESQILEKTIRDMVIQHDQDIQALKLCWKEELLKTMIR